MSPEARRAPPLCLTGDGSRTVKTRSVPIVSQATPLSLCLAANNAHPMLHQIFSSLPSFATGLFPRASACPPWGRACVRNINAERHQQNERSQSFRTRRTRRTHKLLDKWALNGIRVLDCLFLAPLPPVYSRARALARHGTPTERAVTIFQRHQEEEQYGENKERRRV